MTCRLELAGYELGWDCVECDGVAGALDQTGLAGPDQNSSHAMFAQRPGQDGRGSAFANGTVGPENGNPRARDVVDAAVEHSEIRLGPGPTHIEDLDTVDRRCSCELRVVVQELITSLARRRTTSA